MTITEEKWIKLLKARQKKMEKGDEIHQILETFVVVCSDLLKALFLETTRKGLLKCVKQMLKIREHANNILMEIGSMFVNKVPTIHVKFTWSYKKVLVLKL